MTKEKGSLLFAISGGPTSTMNSIASGVFLEALKSNKIDNILAARYGVLGILEEIFFDIRKENKKDLKNIMYTPGPIFGSARYSLKDSDFATILKVFKKYNIKYFIYVGGNDSMITANRIGKFLTKENHPCQIIGIPATIDNDLPNTDHTTGYGSSAKKIANFISNIYCDANSYDMKQVMVVEIMGRDAGWLTAASYLARLNGRGPDLVYLPEKEFKEDVFLSEIKEKFNQKSALIVAVSEGVKTSSGKYLLESSKDIPKDVFGNPLLGGVASYLAGLIKGSLNVKTKAIELNILQRVNTQSKKDVTESKEIGSKSVKFLLDGKTNYMISIKRLSNKPYKTEYILVPLDSVAHKVKSLPQNWLSDKNDTISSEFYEYILPLVSGDISYNVENGIIKYPKLKKVLIK